jgi:non-homologous end joining protein Ku
LGAVSLKTDTAVLLRVPGVCLFEWTLLVPLEIRDADSLECHAVDSSVYGDKWENAEGETGNAAYVTPFRLP